MLYNQKRYIELFKKLERYEYKDVFYKLEKDLYLEFIAYESEIESYIFWKGRISLLLILEEFINKTISGEEFDEKFFQLFSQLLNECDTVKNDLRSEKLKDFVIDLRSENFGSLITFLRLELDYFTDDYENEELYTSIKTCFLNLQKKSY